MLRISRFPVYFEYIFLEAQMELDKELGHFKYVEDLKSPFLMFSGTFDNFGHFDGGTKTVIFKIYKIVYFLLNFIVVIFIPPSKCPKLLNVPENIRNGLFRSSTYLKVQVLCPTPSKLRENCIQSIPEI